MSNHPTPLLFSACVCYPPVLYTLGHQTPHPCHRCTG